ncbi:MAG TPA: hypothetical protein PK156_51015, partial [Polyangium sp.]|nr:hypothetical protein [Polyangium sp.]
MQFGDAGFGAESFEFGGIEVALARIDGAFVGEFVQGVREMVQNVLGGGKTFGRVKRERFIKQEEQTISQDGIQEILVHT